MRIKAAMHQWISSSVLALIAAGSVGISQGQTFTNIIASSFDSSSDPFVNLVHWWGGDVWTATWDDTHNCPSPLVPANPGSGALKITMDWTDTTGNAGYQQPQFAFLDGINGGGWNTAFNVANGTPVDGFYYDLDFDYMFDPGSARSANDGSFGNLQVGFGMPGWSQIWVWSPNGVTNSTWTHVHQYIDPTLPNISQIGGLAIMFPWQTSTGNTNAFYTNASQVTTFYLDNVVFKTNLSKPLTPPTLSLSAVAPNPGLRIQTTASAGTYDRDNIATVDSQYSWIGNGSTPVTYALTIGQYPGTNNPNFQTQIFLAAGDAGAPPGTESAPDWNEPNCVFLQIQNNANGGASARFMIKTNDANANDQLWAGAFATLNEPAGVLGSWSISFVNNTNVTLTAPSGMSTNFGIPDVQAYFPQGAVVAYFGCQPNAAGNVGQGALLTNVKVSGINGVQAIDDHFTGSALNQTTWKVVAAQPSGVAVQTTDVHWTMSWTLPDLNYQLQTAANAAGPWTDSALTTNAIQSGTTKTVAVPDSALPGKNASYFRMVKRTATKLQVLMPGETAAPGTPTGKTGTPTAQPTGTTVNVIVNAVDNQWNPVPGCSDALSITCTDPLSTDSLGNPMPLSVQLKQGTATVFVQFLTTGTQSVTATDTSNPNITSSTGASVTVQ